MPALDLAFVRARFPAFSVPELADRAFFENAGGSYACAPVIDRLTRFYRERKVQPDGPFPASAAGGAEMAEARRRLAAMLRVAPQELSFGPSTTQNTYVLAQTFRQALKSGEAIVVTDQDHEANSGPWRRLAADGVEIREWRIDPATGLLDPERLAPLLADGRVRLVCFPHCSNVVAAINPVAEIAAMVRAAGAVSCVDGVSYAPHGLPDVAALGADIYLFSGYKVYGPHQGLMVIREAVARALPNQGHVFNAEVPYKRFTPAGPDHAQVAACAGIADYLEALHAHHFGAGSEPEPGARAAAVAALMRAHEIAICQPLLDHLAARNDLRLIGPRRAEARAPTVAVALEQSPERVAEALAARGIDCRGDNFYAVRPLAAMGIAPEHGVLRLSMVHYTSQEDVARLIAALDEVLGP